MTAQTIESLPFVTIGTDGMPHLWAVQATGDYAADCATGRTYADALVDHMASTGNPTPFAHIVAAMPKSQSGIEVGFLTEMAGRVSVASQ